MEQEERKARSRNTIFQAALEEFGCRSYDEVTMEGICGRHGISKGMMYHYYSNKDDLFLLCVQDTFQVLAAYIEQSAAELTGQSVLENIKEFFMIREYFFQLHPKRKTIFENAMLRPPKHLAGQIWALRTPIRELDLRFFEQLVAHMPLRPGLSQEQVTRYLACVESNFRAEAIQYRPKGVHDLHDLMEVAEELLDMTLFGVLQGPESTAYKE